MEFSGQRFSGICSQSKFSFDAIDFHPNLKVNFPPSSRSLDPAVKPFPALQIFNILFGILGVCWEYPLPLLIPNTAFHRSIAARLAIYPLSILAAALLYQGTNAAIYYLVGLGIYFWAYSEGEVCFHLSRYIVSRFQKVNCHHRLSACHGNFLNAPRVPALERYKQFSEPSERAQHRKFTSTSSTPRADEREPVPLLLSRSIYLTLLV